MTTLLTIIAGGGLIALLLKVAVFCVIIWAIWALLGWAGIVIPEPIRIILIALICIVVIYWLFGLFGALL